MPQAKVNTGSTREKIEFKRKPDLIVLAFKTGFCNLACPYCYLLHTNKIETMSVNVVEKISEYIRSENRRVRVLLHGGEPLLGKPDEAKQILAPLLPLSADKLIQFAVQTNGLNIDDEWCAFLKEFNFQIGVSLDGPAHLNSQRVDHAGKPAYNRILRSINLLRNYHIDFSIISVINNIGIDAPEELYRFFRDEIRPLMWCINLEEIEGVNSGTQHYNADYEKAYRFWQRLFLEWYQDSPGKRMRIREISQLATHISTQLRVQEQIQKPLYRTYKMIITVGTNGEIYPYDPELAGVEAPHYNNFSIGNILDTPLKDILETRVDNSSYVQDLRRGVLNCQSTCSTFSFCGSVGVNSNKFFQDKLTGTLTHHCLTSRIALYNAVTTGIVNNRQAAF